MLNIVKGAEPPCLLTLRGTPGATWVSVSGEQKADMRRSALREQGALCAYCMRRIRPEPRGDGKPDCTIEHWGARGRGAAPFRWEDLLAVCRGDLDGGLHCDRSRGMRTLGLHPADPRCDVERLVTFTLDGRVRCARHPADVDALNLNHPALVRSRRVIVDLMRQQLQGADLTRLRAAERAWSIAEPRPEYAGVALPIIRRLIRLRAGRSRRSRGRRSPR
jgi:uncharacterized protein (TIGR02646 family)